MDDYNLDCLQKAEHDWRAILVSTLTPLIMSGFKTIIDEAIITSTKNGEPEKYLKCFQNTVSKIPKWNNEIILGERSRIVRESNCAYLEDLITCAHIIQLKILSTMRVSNKQKKVDINIPSIDMFIHKTYINCAKSLYKNVYLYQKSSPLVKQQHNREIELIIRENIIITLRDSIPIDKLLKAYLDETSEENVEENVSEEIIAVEPVHDNDGFVGGDGEGIPSNDYTAPLSVDYVKEDITNDYEQPQTQPESVFEPMSISFSDTSSIQDTDGKVESKPVNFPVKEEEKEDNEVIQILEEVPISEYITIEPTSTTTPTVEIEYETI